MNRLRDWADGLLSSDKGIELLKNTPPAPSMPDLKRRVWASLQQHPTHEPRRAWLPGTRAFAMGVTIALLAGTAGAVVTRRWIVTDVERAAPASGESGESGSTAGGARHEAARSAREAAPAASLAAPPLAAQIDPLDTVQAEDAVRPLQRQAEHAGPRAVTGPVTAPAAPRTRAPSETAQERTQERTEVLDAMVALRRDRDPRRAGVLLDGYLQRHRHGALREEALALATEAADARGDDATAQRLARVYEADYPGGRFQQFARNHLLPKPSVASAPQQPKD